MSTKYFLKKCKKKIVKLQYFFVCFLIETMEQNQIRPPEESLPAFYYFTRHRYRFTVFYRPIQTVR